jgi:hypothetical protein
MRSRYREEYDFKSNKYSTEQKRFGRHDSTEAQRMQNSSVQEVMANNLSANVSGKSLGISRNVNNFSTQVQHHDPTQVNMINIVPSRWSNNGWRYTLNDPTEE